MHSFFNFDWRTYFELYPDLGTPGRWGRFFAYWHYRSYGWREGRCFPLVRQPERFPEESGMHRQSASVKRSDEAVPVVVCIDVEPDSCDPPPGIVPEWRGMQAARTLVTAWRGRLAAGTGHAVAFNWFWRLDPQIAALYGRARFPLERFEKEWRELLLEGDEMAVHTHSYRCSSRGGWGCDYGDADRVDECIASGFAAYREVFGTSPVAHRFGDRWLSDRGLAQVRYQGGLCDLTLEPGRSPLPGGGGAGGFPDMRGIAHGPYPWDGSDFRRSAALTQEPAFWLIPLSTAPIRGPGFSRQTAVLTLNLGLDPQLFRQMVNILLNEQPLLTMVVNTSLLTHPHTIGMVESNLAFLSRHPDAGRLRFVTPAWLLPGLARSSRADQD